jgi:chromosome segregation ATPase
MATKEIDKMEGLKINMEKAKKVWIQAKMNLAKVRGEIDKYEAKKEQITKDLQGAEDVLSNAEDARHRALQLLVTEEMTKSQVDEIKKKHEQAKAEMEDYATMSDIVDGKLLELGKALGELNMEAEQGRRVFWNSVTEILIEETLKNPIALRACISYDMTSGFLRPGDFFEEKIMKRLTIGDSEKIKSELIAQYTK